MTGSAYLPAGTTAQRPAANSYTGQFRYNTQIPQLEYSDGATWNAAGAAEAGLGINIANNIIKTSLLAQFGPPPTGAGVGGAIDGSTYWDNTLGVSFIRYNDGTSTQWVQTNPSGGGGGGGGGSGTVTSVSGSGGTTGLTLTGGPITASGTLTLGGTLAVANGGTGGTTQLTAINNLLPTQTGNTGKVLSTDGTNVSWATAGGGAVTQIIAGLGIGVSPTTGVGNVTITSLGSLTAFSNFSLGDGGFPDTPFAPGFTIRNTITVPAGYTNFLIYSSIAFAWLYDTTLGSTAAFNMIFQNTASAAWLTSLGYQAAGVSPNSNNASTQLSTSVFVSTTSSISVANTFNQVITKPIGVGPLVPQDSSLLVLAYTL
jgi:hypothetical protein